MKRTMVWNWHGDTDRNGEPIPRVLYSGPTQDYKRNQVNNGRTRRPRK